MLHKWKMDHLKFPFCPSLCRPRPQRCGSSPSWTSLTPWASSTARPTCRPSLLPEETSMLPLRDCWAHSPLKDIQYNLTHTHSYIHTCLTRQHTHSFTEKSKRILRNFTAEFRAASGGAWIHSPFSDYFSHLHTFPFFHHPNRSLS